MTEVDNVTILVERDGPDYLISAGYADDTRLGLTAFTNVARRRVVAYSPGSARRAGRPLAWTWQEGVLAFEVITDMATTAAEAQADHDELVAVLGRLTYKVTVQIGDADPEVWQGRAGSVEPADPLNYEDLRDHEHPYAVTIPVYPVRS